MNNEHSISIELLFPAGRGGNVDLDMEPALKHEEKQHLLYLDYARTGVALLVVLWHFQHFLFDGGYQPLTLRSELPAYAILWPGYDFGHEGVEFFWLLSGFIMAYAYANRLQTIRGFAIARFARLYPLHVLTLLMVAGLQAAHLYDGGQSQIYQNNDYKHFVLNLLFISGWGFEDGFSFNGPIWSVSVELFSYAIFFATQMNRNPKVRHWGPIMGVTLLVLLDQAGATGMSGQVVNCLTYFVFGQYLSKLWMARQNKRILYLLIYSVLAIVGIYGTLMYEIGNFIYLAPFAILSLATLSYRYPRNTYRDFDQISYGIYLLHFPVTLAFILILNQMPEVSRNTLVRSETFLGFYIVIVLAAAMIAYRCYERPLKRKILKMNLDRKGKKYE